MKAVNAFSPAETVFEIGSRGKSASATLMKDRRKALEKARIRATPVVSIVEEEIEENSNRTRLDDVEMADEDEIEVRDNIQIRFTFYSSSL